MRCAWVKSVLQDLVYPHRNIIRVRAMCIAHCWIYLSFFFFCYCCCCFLSKWIHNSLQIVHSISHGITTKAGRSTEPTLPSSWCLWIDRTKIYVFFLSFATLLCTFKWSCLLIYIFFSEHLFCLHPIQSVKKKLKKRKTILIFLHPFLFLFFIFFFLFYFVAIVPKFRGWTGGSFVMSCVHWHTAAMQWNFFYFI